MDRSETIRALVRHGIEPRRSLGQNFVVDTHVIEEIVARAGVDLMTDVVEIGPGLGSMTTLLADASRRLVAVEKDDSLFTVLSETFADRTADVTLVSADAMDVDWADLLAGSDDWVLVANLPYNVSVPLIMGVMERAPMVSRAFVMVQREVADRLTATPGGRTIGAPTIHLAWYAAAAVVMHVPPRVFHPEPNVDSAVVELRRRRAPSISVTIDDVMGLVDMAFRQRRKMLRSSIGRVVDAAAFQRAGVEATARPETLDLDDWVALAESVRPTRVDG